MENSSHCLPPAMIPPNYFVQSKGAKSQVSNSTKLPDDVDVDSAEILDFAERAGKERVSNMMREKIGKEDLSSRDIFLESRHF
ncbi:4022_t:CDS:2 [Acaulospora morrowiae]|uniref:4022_t:CDS:1 n=1 Tax=Acaulospora morrowiae TaxID=94023 RepID=A0A9N9CR00_9GLOM|nr:4022_t:CDS:2 [Acaulospora morrowiae]